MRKNIIMLAGLGLALAGCGHSSNSHTASTGTAKAAPAAPAAPAKIAATSKAAFPLTAKGLGVVGSTQVSATGSVQENTAFTAAAPITFVESGDAPLHGTLMTSSRSNSVNSAVRFLMSDQSASSKDAPTAFGILSDHSKADQFAAAGYYGGAAATNIPTSGTATYKGNYAGSQSSSDPAGTGSAHLSGDLALTADFAAGKVKGDISNMRVATAAPTGDLKFSSTMSSDKATYATGTGDAISATIGGVNTVLAGKVEGGFFGAGAGETAGAITAGNGTISSVGAFYGKKQP
jgi:C-lobe and N-lobe beta barrels of Tf-binding protein B